MAENKLEEKVEETGQGNKKEEETMEMKRQSLIKVRTILCPFTHFHVCKQRYFKPEKNSQK